MLNFALLLSTVRIVDYKYQIESQQICTSLHPRMLWLTKRRCWIISLALIVCEILFIFWSEIKLHFLADVGEVELNGYADSEPAESFLQLYRSYCERHFYPQVSNVPAKFLPDYNNSLCVCVPSTMGLFTVICRLV